MKRTRQLLRISLAALVAGLCLLSSSAAAQDFTSNLVGHWAVDDGSGTTALDSTANNHDGTISGNPTWQSSAKVGGGLDFETSDGADSIDVGTFDLTGTGVTLAAWIKPENDGTDQRIITKSSSNATVDHYWQLNHEVGSTELRIRAGGTTERLNVSTSLVVGHWYHLVGTYDGTTLRLYLDGVEVGSMVHSVGGAVSTSSSMPVTIGDSPIGGRAYDGEMDDVRVYDRALSATDVETLFNNGWGSRNLLLVTSNSGSYTTQEEQRKKQFEEWDYAVTAIAASDSQSNIDIALASGNVVWIPETITSGDVDYKFRNATIGVVHEERYLDDKMGFATSESIETTDTQIQITSTSHPITAGLSLGTITITSSSQPLARSNGTAASGAEVLATLGSSNGLIVLDTGATLVNTYNGNSTALGRRVRLPWGGNSFSWASLNSNGLLIAQQAVEWASGVRGPIAHWKLDENSGTTVADSSGNGNDATFTTGSPTWTTGVRSNAITFDGTSEVTTDSTFEPPAVGSVAFWFRFNASPTSSERMLGTGDDWEVRARSDGKIVCNLSNVSTGSFETGEGVAVANRWRHLVATYDSDTNAFELFVDAKLVASGTQNMTAQSAAILTFGARTGSTERFNGALDDVRIYDRKITQAEVAELYGLLGHWKLDENSGTVATDSSGIGNDGTYQGGSAPGANGPFPGSGANAAEFAGTSGDKIALPAMDYDFSDGLTMAVWYNVNSLTGTYTDFFSLSNGSLVDDIWFGLDNSQGLDLFLADTADGASYRGLIETTDLALDSWQHAVATIDASGNANIYRNGKLVASGYVGLPGDIARTQNGIGETTFDHTIDGELFDARLYNRPLSRAQIAELYGLVGQWKLDETSGTTAADSSGSGYDGTHTGGVTVNASGPYPGEGAVAAEFDGSDDYVDLPNITVDFSSGFSAACWVKPATTLGTGEFNAFLDLSNGADVDEIWVGGVGNVGFQLYMTDNDDGSSLRTIEDNTDLEAGKWAHYIATVDSAGNAKLYRNGVLTKTGFTSIPTSVSRSATTIAKSPLNDNYPGELQDVRLYNRPLSDSEITELYGLVGHWTFDEGSGSTFADSTLNANDASFNTGTPAWIDGIYGSALEFDGTNDAVTDAIFDPPESGAVSLWIRSDGPPASRQRPWGVGADYEMWQDTDGLVAMDVGTDGYVGGFMTTEPLYRTSVWYHIVAQYNSDDDSYEIYVNGDLHKSGISTSNIQKQTANLLTFGTRTGSTQRFSGAIDDFRIYTRWLSVADINDLYGRVAYWKFDETSGSVAVDSTNHGNDGALIGSPDWTTAGTIAGALDFDSSNAERIDAGTFEVGGSELTLMAWTRSESGFHDGRIIFKSKGNSAPDQGWGLTVAESLQPDFRVRAGGTWDRIDADGSVSNGQWYHLAGTYDGTTMRLYVNGFEVESEEHSAGGAIDQDPTQYVTLGDSPIGNRTFDGMIDDAQVFDRALTPGEVFDAYKGGRPAGIRILKWVETR